MTNKPDHPILDKEWLRPTLHPAYTRVLCSYLRHKGFSDEEIFNGSLVSWNRLTQENQFISFQQASKVLLNAIKLTGNPWINLSINPTTQLSSHGILGYGVAAGKNVAESLQLVSDWSNVRQKIANYTIEESNSNSRFIIKPLFDFGDAYMHVLNDLVNMTIRLLESITGARLTELNIHFSYPAPSNLSQYEKCFRFQNLYFNSKVTAIDIPKNILATHCLMYNQEAFEMSKRECARIIKLKDTGGHISQRIRNSLLKEDTPSLTLDDMASKLNMSSRNLIRKLKSENLTYQILLDDIRKECAIWYLLNSTTSIESIAYQVGYKDPSNFSRTFKRWLGVTPKNFRLAHK